MWISPVTRLSRELNSANPRISVWRGSLPCFCSPCYSIAAQPAGSGLPSSAWSHLRSLRLCSAWRFAKGIASHGLRFWSLVFLLFSAGCYLRGGRTAQLFRGGFSTAYLLLRLFSGLH